MIALALFLHYSLFDLSLLTPNSRAQLARTSNTYWRFLPSGSTLEKARERVREREEGREIFTCNAAFYKAHSQHSTMSEDQRSPRHPKQEQSPCSFPQNPLCVSVPLAIEYVQIFNYEIRFGSSTRNIFGALCTICYKMWPNKFSCPMELSLQRP